MQHAEDEHQEQYLVDTKNERRAKYTEMTEKELQEEALTIAREIALAEARIALYEAKEPFEGYTKERMLQDYTRIREYKEDMSIILSLATAYDTMSTEKLRTAHDYFKNKKEINTAIAGKLVDNLEYGKKVKYLEANPGSYIVRKIDNALMEIRVGDAHLRLIAEQLNKRSQ